MKYCFSTLLLLAIVIVCFVKAQEQTVVSETYSLDGDFNTIRASVHMEFELTYTSGPPSVVIETEQFMHANNIITVTTKPDYGVYSYFE